ncbi:MAG: helix-turn-helix domain-containing protein [Planctomycetes bacterium]|nr:helix-turn-helix domain-containing protein [Planctomycetota bacterium]
MTPEKEEFYSFDDVLKELKLNEEDLKKIVSEGDLRAFRQDDQIKFRKEDIESFRKGKFYSFDDVLDELKLSEDELNRMVSEGEIQAFKEADRVHFKKEDIDSIKKGKITEPTVILPPDDLLKAGSGKEETFLEEDTSSITEELPFGDTDITIPSLEDEKISLEGDESSNVTAPLKDTEGTFIEETVEDEQATIAEEFAETVAEKPVEFKAPPPPPSAAALRPSRRYAPAVDAPTVRPKVHPAFVIILVLSFVFLMFVGSFLGDIISISSGRTDLPVGVTRDLGQIVIDLFGIKDESGTPIDMKNYKP